MRGKHYPTPIYFRAKRGYNRILWSFSVDVVDVDVDVVVDSLCRIGQTAERIATRLGTVTLQVVTSFSSES